VQGDNPVTLQMRRAQPRYWEGVPNRLLERLSWSWRFAGAGRSERCPRLLHRRSNVLHWHDPSFFLLHDGVPFPELHQTVSIDAFDQVLEGDRERRTVVVEGCPRDGDRAYQRCQADGELAFPSFLFSRVPDVGNSAKQRLLDQRDQVCWPA